MRKLVSIFAAGLLAGGAACAVQGVEKPERSYQGVTSTDDAGGDEGDGGGGAEANPPPPPPACSRCSCVTNVTGRFGVQGGGSCTSTVTATATYYMADCEGYQDPVMTCTTVGPADPSKCLPVGTAYCTQVVDCTATQPDGGTAHTIDNYGPWELSPDCSDHDTSSTQSVSCTLPDGGTSNVSVTCTNTYDPYG